MHVDLFFVFCTSSFNYFMLQCLCSYLHRVMKKNKTEDMFQFVDYDLISAIGSETPTARSHDLSVIYSKGKPGQIFLIPYNTGYVNVLSRACGLQMF